MGARGKRHRPVCPDNKSRSGKVRPSSAVPSGHKLISQVFSLSTAFFFCSAGIPSGSYHVEQEKYIMLSKKVLNPWEMMEGLCLLKGGFSFLQAKFRSMRICILFCFFSVFPLFIQSATNTFTADKVGRLWLFHHCFFLFLSPPVNSLLSSGSVSTLRSAHLSFCLRRTWYEEIFCITKVA